jgi:serine/threonine-protein phosphatase 2A regulatory subunit B'
MAMKLLARVKSGVSDEVSRAKNASAKKAQAAGAGRKAGQESISSLPPLREAAANERGELLKKKIQACCVLYDFSNNAHNAEKEAKRQTLLELVEYVNNTRQHYSEGMIVEVVEMVSANVFRALSPSAKTGGGEDEDEPTLEPSWPHLQIVYEFFLRFVVSHEVDPKIARKVIDQIFILKLIDLFDSEDPRERDYLKTILHRVYGKIMTLRLFIRKATQSLFYRVIYDSENQNGVPELLEIMGSIINGFALPLKEEHHIFLERCLLPLHRVKYLASFHQQLSYCVMQYVEKESWLAQNIVDAMLRMWTVTSTSKEVLFLNEIEEVLEMIQPKEFQAIQVRLFKRIADCIRSQHFQVAERALFIWNNDEIVKLINANRQTLFPIICGALYQNSTHHWNGTVHGLTYNVLKLLMETDSVLFDECSSTHKMETEKLSEQNQARTDAWEKFMVSYRSAPAALLELEKHVEQKIPEVNADLSSNMRDY